MHITLPDGLQDFIDQQVDENKLGSADEFVRMLIQNEQDRTQLRDKLLQGANSPVSSQADKAFFEKLRSRIIPQEE